MGGQIYSIREALNRILRSFKGQALNELPETLPGEVLSENEALSDLAELLNNSLPGQLLFLPTALSTALTTAGFASGTATSLTIVTGTSQLAVGITRFVFGNGISVSVTGTTVYLNA